MKEEKVYMLDYYMQECRYGYLSEIVSNELFRDNLKYHVEMIVMCNIRYRDSLRDKGMEGVIKMLIQEVPSLVDCQDVLDYLRSEWKNNYHGHIADYDIQMLPEDQRVFIAGEWFDGLKDIVYHVEMSAKCYCGKRWYTSVYDKHGVSSLHVGNIRNSFDDTFYNNFLFFRQPVTENLLDNCYERMPMSSNFCLVNEHIPTDYLPVVYHNSEKQYMLLATAKNNN